MKHFFLYFLIFACTNVASDQKAVHYNNKGITCDAIKDAKGQTIICGESAMYTSDKPTAQEFKDAFFIINSTQVKSNIGYSYGNTNSSERFERIVISGNDLVLNGFSGESKNKFLFKINNDGATIWGIQSEKYKTFETGDLAIDPSGNILMITKDPTSESYHGCFHLIDKNGTCKWSKDISSIEFMQDIICTKDNHFLMSYKQKGAYIDGSTRKKYWMNSFNKVDQSGQIIWSKKFHLDYSLVEESVYSKILEDKSGNLYFIGKMELRNPKKQHLFISRTDKNGKILWSNIYNCQFELNFKNGCFDAEDNLILLADGYGKNGGIAYMQLTQEGDIKWASIMKTANYEQAISILVSEQGYEIIWDKLLNFASFTINDKGQSCAAKVEELKLVKQNVPILIDDFKGTWQDVESDWKKIDFKLLPHQNVVAISDCND